MYLLNYTSLFSNFSSIETYFSTNFKWPALYLISPAIVLFTLPHLVFFVVGVISPLIALIYYICFIIVCKRRPEVNDYHCVRKLTAWIFVCHSYIWHSHEIVNFERIPESGPALIIYYHGSLPIDYYYLLAKCYLFKQRIIITIAYVYLFKIPVFNWWLKTFLRSTPGTRDGCTEILKNGDLLAIAPGGVREQLFSENYHLLWNNRIGFAKVAISAKAPIIPVFTVNVNEAYRTITFGKSILRRLYEVTGFPTVPIYGGFPVKLRTIVGEPITFDASITPEQLASKTAEAIETLIRQHQTPCGNILKAISERFSYKLT